MEIMQKVLFIGSHLGYPMDTTPLGGGAMVGLQLARHWAREEQVELTVIGSGPQSPDAGLKYVQLPTPGADPALSTLSELAYAGFCRDFSNACTAHVLAHPEQFPPQKTAVIVNDISESPDLDALAGAGYAIASIWHVDVVDFFNRLYLGAWLAPERWTALFAWLEDGWLGGFVPSVLKLVFSKQRQTVRAAQLLVVPSRGMQRTLERCYGPQSTLVLPWGGWDSGAAAGAETVEALRAQYNIAPGTRVILTLSRISPEKGVHYLLEALRKLERAGVQDVCLLLCGEAAFMQGVAYHAKLRQAAGELKNVRVIFPGYLDDAGKRAHLSLADIFVSPSVHESYGLTIVEALRAGLPVIASDHYGVAEILRPDYACVVPYREPDQRAAGLAAALRELLENEPRRCAMGQAAREAGAKMRFSDAAQRLLGAASNLTDGGAG
jgi:glycosyltransferase involved in cell wall biosynthesis